MQRQQAAAIGWKLRVYDVVTVATLFLVTLAFRESLPLWWPFDFVQGDEPALKAVRFGDLVHLLPWVVVGWVFGLHYGGMYQDFRRVRSDVLLLRFVRSSLVALGLLLVVDFLIQFDNRLSRTFLLSYFGLSTLGLWASRRLLVDWRKVWSREPVNILAIGLAEEAEPFLEILRRHSDWGLRIVGVLCPEEHADQSQLGGVPVLGKLSRLPQVLSERNIGQVFLTGRVWDDNTLRFVADTCEEVGVTFSMDANFLGMGISRAEVQDYQGWSVLSFSTTPQDSEALSIKRGMDVIGAAAALVVSSPILAVVALLIKWEDGGPIFFSQERSGLYGRPFRMHKFRSMSVDAEAQKATLEQQNERSGPVFKIKNDPRVTRIGKFIRKYSLDEFPQFWNVLVGEMSLVGPRPPIPSEVVRYERWQMRRLSMKPGITCLWQVKGRNNVDFDTWMRLDLEYIDNWSLFLDLRLLVETVPAVIRARGAS